MAPVAPMSVKGNSLIVRVKHATGLRNTDGPFAGKSDPYVVLRLVDSHGKTVMGPKQTSVKKDTLSPVWNEDVVFEGLQHPAAYTLKVNIFDKDTLLGTGHFDWLSADDKLGSGEVDLGMLYNTRAFQDKELTVERRKLGLFTAKLNIGLSTLGCWGTPAPGAPVGLMPVAMDAGMPAPALHAGNTLAVRVKNATGLRNTDGPFAGKSDPYVVVRVVNSSGKTVAGPKQTSVKDDTLSPVWNEDIVFEGLDTPAAYSLIVNIFDKDTLLGTGHLDWLSADDKLGSARIDLGTLYNTRQFQDKELIVERRKFGLFTAKLNVGVSTLGGWGNSHHSRGGC